MLKNVLFMFFSLYVISSDDESLSDYTDSVFNSRGSMNDLIEISFLFVFVFLNISYRTLFIYKK